MGIDGLYGPTETLLVADDSADARIVAADLLAQAEHDPLASAVLITSALFALAHLAQGWSSATIVYIYAIAFQYLYISTESLLVPVLAHFVYDVAAGFYLGARRPLAEM